VTALGFYESDEIRERTRGRYRCAMARVGSIGALLTTCAAGLLIRLPPGGAGNIVQGHSENPL
jgi:hypothetical protein